MPQSHQEEEHNHLTITFTALKVGGDNNYTYFIKNSMYTPTEGPTGQPFYGSPDG